MRFTIVQLSVHVVICFTIVQLSGDHSSRRRGRSSHFRRSAALEHKADTYPSLQDTMLHQTGSSRSIHIASSSEKYSTFAMTLTSRCCSLNGSCNRLLPTLRKVRPARRVQHWTEKSARWKQLKRKSYKRRSFGASSILVSLFSFWVCIVCYRYPTAC